MFVIPAVLMVAAQQPSVFQPVIQAHNKLIKGAVHVAVEINSSEKLRYSYDLYFVKGGKFRLDWNDSRGKVIIVGDAGGIWGYDPAGNRYVYRKSSGLDGTFSSLYVAFDIAEPLLSAYLSKSGGVEAFINFFGKRNYVKAGAGKYLSEKSPKLELITDPATNLIRRMTMYGGNGVRGRWTVSSAPMGVDVALKFQLPRGARRVESLSADSQPPTYATTQAKGVVQKSRQAYASLTTLKFTTVQFQFPGNVERRLATKSVWEHNGKFQFTSDETSPLRKLRIVYGGGKLRAWNQVSSTDYESTCSVNRIPSKLSAASFEPDLLTSCLLRDENFWDKIAVSGSKVKLLGDKALLGGKWCLAVEVKTTSGWTTVAYVAENSNMVQRMERRLEIDGKPVYSETVVYEYQIVGLPIPGSEWGIALPSRKPSPFPGES